MLPQAKEIEIYQPNKDTYRTKNSIKYRGKIDQYFVSFTLILRHQNNAFNGLR